MSRRTLFPVILGSGGPSGNYAVNLNMSMDSNYVISAQLVDQNGNALGTEQTIDLPLESVVVSGSYDNQTKSIILTLDNGNTITIPVGDLVSGLQTTIDSNNPLNADYLTDGTTNKVYTAAEQSKLSGIAAGAEVNVQSDWNQSDNTADDFIKNKPTLGTMAAESASDYTPTSGLATVATTGSYPDLHNRPTIPTVNNATITLEDSSHVTIDSFTLNQSSNKTITIPSGGGSNEWFGTQEEFDAIPQADLDPDTNYYINDRIDYSEIVNTPFIPNDTSQLQNSAGFVSQRSLNDQMFEMAQYIKDRDVYLTAAEYAALEQGGLLEEDKKYHIEGEVSTVTAVVTFTDQTTATYEVYIKPSI